MVISTSLKEDFFDKINGKHILIIVSNGVDSVCTFKIIKHIFKNYNISFSYAFIKTKIELKTNFEKYGQIDNVLLINCGCLFDVIEYLEIGETDNKVVYLIDSQRPIHINNFYNTTQVKILTLQEQFDNVPDFHEVFLDEEDEDSESESEDESAGKRLKYDKDYLETKIKKREWKKQREEIMLEYENHTFHGTSSSLVAYHISTLIHQDSNELLWSAIVGHTSQFILNFINRQVYCLYIDLILSHLTQLNANRRATREKNLLEIKIEHVDELVLWLYRHGTLKQALSNTPVTIKAFKLYTTIGCRQLNDFLAFIGVSICESEKAFLSMKLEIKDTIVSLFKDNCHRVNISKDELFLPSFLARSGYHTRMSAVDATFVIAATLDNIEVCFYYQISQFRLINYYIKDTSDFNEKFLKAVNFMSISNKKQIDTGLTVAKNYVDSICKYSKDVFEHSKVTAHGSFLYVLVKSISPLTFHMPLTQYLLARYILETVYSHRPRMGKRKKTELAPLILCSEVPGEDTKRILYGIPPLKSDKGRNFFSQIFDLVLASVNSQIEQSSIDMCRIEINTSDQLRIFNRISGSLDGFM